MKYIAAASGGPDSMFLLHKYKKNIAYVCHVNYQKRDSAKRDYLIVKKFCNQNKIKLFLLNVTKQIYDEYYKINKNFQDIARKIRYDFFCKCANKTNINNVLIAHNKNDFIETALMQKNRNSESLFYGILKKNKYKNINIHRPLINIYKKDILNYCEKNKINYGIDETNFSNIYQRNVIRGKNAQLTKNELEKLYQSFLKHNKNNNLKNKRVENLFQNWTKTNFNVDFYKKIPNELKKFIIYKFFVFYNIENISKNKINLVDDFILKNQTNKKLRLGKNIHISKINQHIINL